MACLKVAIQLSITMKKLTILFFILGVILMHEVQAQQTQTMNPEEMISMQMEKIKPVLDLDNLETILVKNVLIKFTKERMALRNQNLEKDLMMAKMKEINEQQTSELSEILSEDQMEKFQKLQEEFRNRSANPARRAGGGRM